MPEKPKNRKKADGPLSIWTSLQIRDSSGKNDLETLLRAAKIPLTWQDLYNFNMRFGHREFVVVPPFITDFMAAYISDKKPQSILDPWAGTGSIILPIVEKNAITEAVGISPVKTTFNVAQLMEEHSFNAPLLGDEPAFVDWIEAPPYKALEQLGTFDVIVSSLPVGLPSTYELFGVGRIIYEVRDSETHTLALKAAEHLSADGEAIFIFSNGFFLSEQSAATRRILPKLGLHINSIIALPLGVFATGTSIELSLIFISRHKSGDIFIGQLSPDRNPKPLIENMRNRKRGVVPELGRLLKLEDYRGWRALVTAEEQQRLVERSGLTPVPLTEVVQEINLADRKNEEHPFKEHPNSIYLPLIGTSPAVTALSDFSLFSKDSG